MNKFAYSLLSIVPVSMKLYFRMLILLLKLRRLGKLSSKDNVEFNSRVWPTDLDLNGHMTNTRYVSLFDLSIIQLFSQMGFMSSLTQMKWKPMINARNISFLKELSPFESFKVSSKIICWDRSFVYIEHRIRNKQSKTSAVCYSRGLFLAKKGLISFKDVLAHANELQQGPTDIAAMTQNGSPEMPEHIKHWKETLNHQKKQTKSS